MKDMKRTFVKMMLLAVLSAVAGKSWADNPKYSITTGEITGGMIEFFAGENGPDINAGRISSAEKNTKVFIVTLPDAIHKSEPITWRVERSAPSSQAESRTRTAGYSDLVKVENFADNTYYFIMPDDGSNVTVNAVFAEKETTKVSYFDPTAAPGPKEMTVDAYTLEGTETDIGVYGKTTWYVCATPATANGGAGLTYTKQLRSSGTVNLILADGCKMSVGTAASPITDEAIKDLTDDFTIYGQTAGSGTLEAYSKHEAIYSTKGSLNFNGGTVEVSGTEYGIYSWSAMININGGTLKAVSSDGTAIRAEGFYHYFNGGKVTAIGGTSGISVGNGELTFGWSHPDDYFYASSYEFGSNRLKYLNGKRFVAVDSENKASVIFGSTSGSGEANVPNTISLTNADAEKTIAGKTIRPIAVAETDAQGATTVSPGFLLSVTASGITPVGRTEPDFTLGTTPYYIYKSGGDGVTIPVSVTNYGQTGAEFTVSIDGAADTSLPDAAVTISDGLATAALLWTSANDVELKSARYYCTGVKYLKWEDAEHPNVEYTTPTAANNTTKVYILTGGTGEDLPEGWYVVKNWNTSESNNSGIDALYTGTVFFTGDTHLILADGARMDVDARNATINGNGIHVEPGSLTIYAQSTGPDMGSLNTFPKYGCSGIQALSSPSETSITINGGNITCESSNATGIEVWNIDSDASITINGGKVTVTGTDMNNGILTSSYYNSSITINDGIVDLNVSNTGICVENTSSTNSTSTLSVLGGKVNDCSEHGFSSYTLDGVGEIILGWKNPDDYIYTTKYYDESTVRTVSGKRFVACTPAAGETPESPFAYIEGGYTITASQLSSLAGKKLMAASEPVKYLAWDDSKEEVVETNTADDKNDASDFLYVLQGTETEIGTAGQETFYLATGTLNYDAIPGSTADARLTTNGDVHLILADGATMNVNGNNCGIESLNHLYIHSQGGTADTAEGTLSVSTDGTKAISAWGDLTIDGGIITATATGSGICWGIIATGDITITGGQTTATSTSNDQSYAIYAGNRIIVTGGTITANGLNDDNNNYYTAGIKASTITLDWSDASDFILASSYDGTVKIPAGRYFATLKDDGTVGQIYGNAATDGDYTFDATAMNAIAGKTLHPVAMIPSSGGQYIGYSEQGGDMAIIGGTAQSYAVVGYDFSTSPAVVYVTPVTGLMKGCGVVLGPASGETYLPDEVGIIIQTGSTAEAIENSFTSASPLRNFIAAPADGTTTLDQQIAQTLGTGTPGQPDYVEADPSDYIVFMIIGGQFRPVNRTAASVLPVNTAVLAVSKMDILRGGTVGTKPAAARRIILGDGEANGIVSLPAESDNNTDPDWYTLDGRRLDSRPTAKGVYIRKGEKVVVR